MTDLERRYLEIQNRFSNTSDFKAEELQKSRDLFDFGDDNIWPKSFDVWTFVAGLPVPISLAERFRIIVESVRDVLGTKIRLYEVPAANYHWEAFIVKRPGDSVDSEELHRASELAREVTTITQPIEVFYRGFLITSEGVIIVKGFGDFTPLREGLKKVLPFASRRQSSLGHISLGRILDRVGQDSHLRLKTLVSRLSSEEFGRFSVREIKYVHETRWYMEEKEIRAFLPLGCD